MARRANKRQRYSWALEFKRGDLEYERLSGAARTGLGYAVEFAEDAQEQRNRALRGEQTEGPMRAQDVDPTVSPVHVYRLVKQARIELFGKDLSVTGVHYRMRKREERAVRPCAERGCDALLPRLARAKKLYCAEHSTPAARVRRHRLAKAARPTDQT